MNKKRLTEKTRFINKSRIVIKTREDLKYAKQVSDFWATINSDASGITLSFLINGNAIDPNKSVKLDGINQSNYYVASLYKTNLFILHTEISLSKGQTHIIEDWNGNTKEITLPTDDLKIAYMSDLHYISNPSTTEMMFERVKESNPDYLICGGDWVLDDIGLPDGYHWSRFLRNGMPILNENKLIPWLIPTVGNHDHTADGWFGIESEVPYLHNVFPFDNGEIAKGFGVVD